MCWLCPGAVYLTCHGTLLEGKGIVPDEEIKLSREMLKGGRDSRVEREVEVQAL
jgi:C-terminal processing protease CtpA/Prc